MPTITYPPLFPGHIDPQQVTNWPDWYKNPPATYVPPKPTFKPKTLGLTEETKVKVLELELNLAGYSPKDITVKLFDNKLQVKTTTIGGRYVSETIEMPADADLSTVTVVYKHGLLTIIADVRTPVERELPIVIEE